MEFKDRLRELRLQKGYSQVELGKSLGLSNSTISMYERGERQPDYETLDLIADFFNVDVNYLLGKEVGSMYYLDPKVYDIAMELSEDNDLFLLFEKTRDANFKQRLLGIVKLMENSND